MSVKKTKNPRMCVSCRHVSMPSNFIRIVRKPDKTVVIDYSGKMDGRGAYLCRSSDCLREAIKRKRLESSLRVAIPERIYDELKLIISREGDYGSKE